jgi:hypothetical protein
VNTLLISCTGSKRPGTHRALDLYKPRQFKIARELAARPDWRVLVLSAEHGLIDGGDVIECYERPMTQPRADELAAATPANYPSGPVFVYGGAKYRGIVRAWARDLGASDPVEVVGLNEGCGHHYSALVALARSMG